jgi:hypothetical protein
MTRGSNISFNTLKRGTTLFFLVGFTFFAFASIGGDKNKSKSKAVGSSFLPLRTAKGFTLKSGSSYRGNIILKEERVHGAISYNSLITYQKGNSTYILPNRYRIPVSTQKTSLQLINLRFKLCK